MPPWAVVVLEELWSWAGQQKENRMDQNHRVGNAARPGQQGTDMDNRNKDGLPIPTEQENRTCEY